MSHLSTSQLELMHVAMSAWFKAGVDCFTTIDLNTQTCGVYTPHTFEVYRGFIIGSESVHGMYRTLDIGLSHQLGDLDHNGDWWSRFLQVHEESDDWELVAGLGRDVIDLFYYEHFREKIYSFWRNSNIEQRIMNPYYRPFQTDDWYYEIEEALARMVMHGEGQMTERRYFMCAKGIIACNWLFPVSPDDELYCFAEETTSVTPEVDV